MLALQLKAQLSPSLGVRLIAEATEADKTQ